MPPLNPRGRSKHEASVGLRRHRRAVRVHRFGGCVELPSGCAGHRRPVLPAGRQRRIRRRALLAGRELRPADRPPHRRRGDRGDRQREPLELQPRSARLDGARHQRRRLGGEVEPQRRRAHRHAQDRVAQGTLVHGRRALRRRARGARGWLGRAPHRRRCRDHRRAARRLQLVPGQRPSVRQGDVHDRGHGPEGPRGCLERRLEEQEDARRSLDVPVGDERSDGLVPRDRDGRRVRHHVLQAGRPALLRRD